MQVRQQRIAGRGEARKLAMFLAPIGESHVMSFADEGVKLKS